MGAVVIATAPCWARAGSRSTRALKGVSALSIVQAIECAAMRSSKVSNPGCSVAYSRLLVAGSSAGVFSGVAIIPWCSEARMEVDHDDDFQDLSDKDSSVAKDQTLNVHA